MLLTTKVKTGNSQLKINMMGASKNDTSIEVDTSNDYGSDSENSESENSDDNGNYSDEEENHQSSSEEWKNMTSA